MKRRNFSEDLLTYSCKECRNMTEQEIAETAKLFSENYGKWSQYGPNPGKRILFKEEMIRKSFVEKPDRFVALVYYQKALVGHAFYMRRFVPKKGNITWILQLVVKEDFRGHSIGTKLMHSIWQLSDSYAWGLYTSNPSTVRALENATMRSVDVRLINREFKTIAPYLDDLLDSAWIESYNNGMANTRFHVDYGNLVKNIAKIYPDEERKFPLSKKLPEGHEWVAIVFDKQKAYVNNQEQLDMYTQYSEANLVRAYSEMDMANHVWNSHTKEEADFLMRYLSNNINVVDIGCGTGRLTNELASRGLSVHGLDFSEKQLSIGRASTHQNARFICKDVRRGFGCCKYDAAICLYDVVGSFPEEKDNIKILKRTFSALKPGGILVISVMNMTLTKRKCAKHKNIIDDINVSIDRLLKLKASNTMQTTGDVFDGKYILVDNSSGICYRKEQFFSEDYLPQEYVIRDRRYTEKGISTLIQNVGFIVEESYCFQAGHIDVELPPSSLKAKEILVIARKPKRKRLQNTKAWK